MSTLKKSDNRKCN